MWGCRSNSLFDPISGLVTDPTELVRRLMTTLQAHNYVGSPTDDFEEMCVPWFFFPFSCLVGCKRARS